MCLPPTRAQKNVAMKVCLLSVQAATKPATKAMIPADTTVANNDSSELNHRGIAYCLPEK